MGHIRLILANTAIGNDIPIEVAQAAVDWDCLLGYHPYWPVKNHVVPADEWQWFSGRWTSMDADWRAQGVFVEWAFTEAGAVRHWGDWPDIGLDPMGGWRHPECHGFNLDEYLATIELWMNQWHAWNEVNGHRALPPVLFDSRPSPGEWQSFQIWQPEMDAIAQFVATWQPQQPPEPPVDPCLGLPREQYERTNNVIPDWASEERAAAVFLEGWRRSRETAGGSYDDAGIGDLDQKLARLHGIEAGLQQVYRDWFEEIYPGTVIEFVELPLTING